VNVCEQYDAIVTGLPPLVHIDLPGLKLLVDLGDPALKSLLAAIGSGLEATEDLYLRVKLVSQGSVTAIPAIHPGEHEIDVLPRPH
jgi:hypothetical protein